MSNSKKSKRIAFNAANFLRDTGEYLSPHDGETYWEDFPGCCTASILLDLPDRGRVEDNFSEYRLQLKEDGFRLEPITKGEVFLKVWEEILSCHRPGNNLGVMTLVQSQHTPAVRALLRREGWKKCGERKASSGNTVSLWARF